MRSRILRGAYALAIDIGSGAAQVGDFTMAKVAKAASTEESSVAVSTVYSHFASVQGLAAALVREESTGDTELGSRLPPEITRMAAGSRREHGGTLATLMVRARNVPMRNVLDVVREFDASELEGEQLADYNKLLADALDEYPRWHDFDLASMTAPPAELLDAIERYRDAGAWYISNGRTADAIHCYSAIAQSAAASDDVALECRRKVLDLSSGLQMPSWSSAFESTLAIVRLEAIHLHRAGDTPAAQDLLLQALGTLQDAGEAPKADYLYPLIMDAALAMNLIGVAEDAATGLAGELQRQAAQGFWGQPPTQALIRGEDLRTAELLGLMRHDAPGYVWLIARWFRSRGREVEARRFLARRVQDSRWGYRDYGWTGPNTTSWIKGAVSTHAPLWLGDVPLPAVDAATAQTIGRLAFDIFESMKRLAQTWVEEGTTSLGAVLTNEEAEQFREIAIEIGFSLDPDRG